MKVTVGAVYSTIAHSEIELPEGKTWDDVAEFWMKWSTFYIKWKNDPELIGYDLKLDGDTDWCRPDTIRITDENDDELDEA